VTSAPPYSDFVAADPTAPWPVLSDDALYGLAGELVRLIEPATEADPVAVLAQFLVMFGSAAGGVPHYIAEATRHRLNLDIVLVGQTSKARKGSSEHQVRVPMQQADHEWATTRIGSGLSTGEGLIWAVRDPIYKTRSRLQKGQLVIEQVTEDAGIADKRLLVIEPEFASTLRVLQRDGNTLSPVLRQAWDGATLRTLTKNSPAVATNPHISVIGHITREELAKELGQTERVSGFANRFLFICARRSKMLPNGGTIDAAALTALAERVRQALEFARDLGHPMLRNPEAAALWCEQYPGLSAGHPGLFGAVVGRAEAQVCRLSCVYAVLDHSGTVRTEHLRAALALWQYCEASARYLFDTTAGENPAQRILGAVTAAGAAGLTRTQISYLFGRNKPAGEIEEALAGLQAAGKLVRVRETTGGRPVERVVATFFR
jgi:hypothetical protein